MRRAYYSSSLSEFIDKDVNNKIMMPDYYNGTYNYLKEIGIEEIF